ncbi:ABC transporter permease [Tersicoccus solisilvae]|uniref:ABC transporter permease n=1 Tax=Tersicoccus solisilvae TaxID=1882339 RepID=A0ABQ1P641_9MICC|nr:ABC transporter permease [Tersicoccus solisilvae]GGC90769.1 ABC transporter permease [Tersicoccus solisilvae]
MLTFILRRLAAGLVLLLTITTLTYVLLYISGTNIARNILGEFATPEQIAAKQAELGLDQPLITRYLDWLGGAFSGDLGRSWFTGEPVLQALSNRLPVTLTIVFVALVVAAVIAAALGIAAAVYRGWVDRFVQFLSLAGDALPSFVVAIVLVTTLAIQAKLFPATGFVPFATNPGLWLASIALPVAALVFQLTASAAQQFRSAIIDVRRRDFVRTLRSRGLGEREVLTRHVLRSAAPPALTILSLNFVALLGGSITIEQIFALPGIGPLAIGSTTQGDIPMVMGVVVYTVIMVILVNIVVDLLNGWLNPKVRVS